MIATRVIHIFRARRGIFLLTLGITIATALTVSMLMPKTYTAKATMVLNYKGVDPVSGITLPAQLMPSYMATQIDVIKSISVAQHVVDELKLTEDKKYREKFEQAADGGGNLRNWIAEQLLKNLEVIPGRESSVVYIGFKSSSRETSANTANAFASAYQAVSNEIKADPLKRAAVYMSDQIVGLRERFEVAQRKVSAYQQAHGITSADGRHDVDMARLDELSTQLAAVQAQRIDAAARGRQSQFGSGGEAPDVIANPLIQTLKSQLAQAESKLRALSANLMPEHPQYMAQQAEVRNLRAALNEQITSISRSINNSAAILRQRENELLAAIQEQKTRLLDVNRRRDELKILSNEMETAQRTYESAMQRFAQIRLEGQSNQSEAALLAKAEPPLLPSSPRVPLNVALAVIFGSLLGAGFVALAENRDRRVRTRNDLSVALQAPVLGVVTWGRDRSGERPRALPTRGLLLAR